MCMSVMNKGGTNSRRSQPNHSGNADSRPVTGPDPPGFCRPAVFSARIMALQKHPKLANFNHISIWAILRTVLNHPSNLSAKSVCLLENRQKITQTPVSSALKTTKICNFATQNYFPKCHWNSRWMQVTHQDPIVAQSMESFFFLTKTVDHLKRKGRILAMLSSTEPEIVALVLEIKELKWIYQTIKEVGLPIELDVVSCDNQGALKSGRMKLSRLEQNTLIFNCNS